jgi:hypothetical protein
MTETAGWGAAAPWLPPAVRAAQLREDAAEAREARRAAAISSSDFSATASNLRRPLDQVIA